MAKRIFITGIAGFIGYHTALALQSRGDIVIGCDNFNPYYDPSLKKARTDLLTKQGIEVHTCDIKDLKPFEELIDRVYPTHILHLAAQAGVRASLTQPQAYIDANITGFLNVLEIVRKRVEIPLIYASSSSVYGHNEKVPFAEHDRVDLPASLYAVTKRCGEMMAHVYHNLFGIKATGLRFFTVYGEWGRPDMAYFSFVKKIFDGQPIDLYNNGEMERDFTYISDIVDGIIRSIDLEASLEVFNLGNHQPTSLKRFIEIIEGAVGKKANIQFLPMQPGDVVRTFADIDHSHNKLGFTPKTCLEVGIPRFVDWYRSYFHV